MMDGAALIGAAPIAGPVQAAGVPAGPPVLLERDAALGAVCDALQAAGGGEGGALLVIGAAGIGKTSVLTIASALAEEAGFRVAVGVGTPMEAGLAYGLIGQAVVALGGHAVDELDRIASPWDRSGRLYRIFRLIAQAAAETPLLLALDDLHWSDPDSLEVLGYLCRRLAGSRTLVLGTLRAEPDPASRLAEELVGSGHARVVSLEPLSREASLALLGDAVGLESAEREDLLESCAGSPLLLTVAASALSGGTTLAPAPVDCGFGSILLLERFVGLGAQAFAYVCAGAVFGVRFKPALAGALAGLADRTWKEAHGRLVRARLLTDLGGGWTAFVHPLFAQALFEDLPASERERAHERAFRLLVTRGEPAAVAAEHAIGARLTGDPLAVEVTARAGREALAQGALGAACAHLRDAAQLAGSKVTTKLLLDYAHALSACGQLPEAQTVCRRLLARPDLDHGTRSQTLTLLARGAVVAGRPAEAERLYEEAAAAAGDDRQGRLAALADAALTCHVASPIPWVLDVTRRALELAAPGTPTRQSLEIMAAYLRLISGDPSARDLLMGECRHWLNATASGDHGWAWTLAMYALNALELFEDFGGASEVFEREFSRAVEDGAPIMINALAIAYADFVHRTGRTREALELVQSANAVSDMHLAPWYEVAMSVLLSELGRDQEAEPYLAALRSVKSTARRRPPATTRRSRCGLI